MTGRVNGKAPHPSDINEERALLSCVIQDPSLLTGELADVTPDYFFRPDHRALWVMVQSRALHGKPMDEAVLSAEIAGMAESDQRLFGGLTYVLDLAGAASSPMSAPSHAAMLNGLRIKRDIIERVEALRDGVLAMHHGDAVDNARDLIEQHLGVMAKKLTPGKARAGELLVTCMADVTATDVDWLLPGLVPRGMITLLVGNPGGGKSMWSIDLAARTTRGELGPRRNVVFVADEDHISAVQRKRMEAAGADLDHVHMVRGMKDAQGKPKPFTMAAIVELEALVASLDAALLVVDPAQAYLGSVDENSDAELREILAPLTAMLERRHVAGMLVKHMNKKSDTAAAYRVSGSIGWVGVSRSMIMLVADPEEPNRRILFQEKNSVGRLADPVAFFIRSHDGRAYIEIDPMPVSWTLQECLAGTTRSKKKTDAAEWLLDLIKGAGGKMTTTKIRIEAEAANMAWRTVQRAAATLPINRGKGPGAMWALEGE